MVMPMVFINLFFVPVITLYLVHRNEEKELGFTVELLCHYCIAVVCNIPLTKMFGILVRYAMKIDISMDSGYYTMIAILSACLLYLLPVVHKNTQICVEVSKDESCEKEIGE